MYSAKRGFILTDALMSVAIVAVCCLLIFSIIYSHYHTEDAIGQASEMQEEENSRVISGSERCGAACGETAEPGP